MAEVITTAVNPVKWDDGKAIHVVSPLAFDGGTYTTNGIAFNPLTLAGSIGSSQPPLIVGFESKAGHSYQWDRANNKLIIRAPGGAEITGGAALPAGVTGDSVRCYSVFAKFQ